MTTQLCVRFTHFLDTGKLMKGLLLWAERHIDRQTERQTDRQRETETHRETEKETHRQR